MKIVIFVENLKLKIMYKFLSILGLFLAIQTYSFSQINQTVKIEDAHYLGDDADFHKMLLNKIIYSPEAIKANVGGYLQTSVFVEADSTVSKIEFLNTMGYGIEEQVKAIISPMKFAPKVMNGRNFKSDILYNIMIQAH